MPTRDQLYSTPKSPDMELPTSFPDVKSGHQSGIALFVIHSYSQCPGYAFFQIWLLVAQPRQHTLPSGELESRNLDDGLQGMQDQV